LDETSATAGAVNKFFRSGGVWTAAESYPTTIGGFGLAAATNGAGGVCLYVTTGSGSTASNRLIKLTDTAAWNAAISITTASNVTLYTAAAGTTLKGVAFAPVTPPLFGASYVTVNPGGRSTTINFTGISGYTCEVQRATTLSGGGNWTTLTPGQTPGASGRFSIVDDFTDLPGGTPPAEAFYRLVWNP
jgi:hypothetical protein